MHIVEIPSFLTPYGGEFCIDQARALKALGHEVRVVSAVQLSVKRSLREFISLPYLWRWEEADGVEVYKSYVRGIPKCIRPNVNRWTARVRSMFDNYVRQYGKPDILHAHCAKWAGHAAMLIGRQYGIPYVVTEHLPLLLLENEFGKAPSSAWQIPLLKACYEQADMVIPVSEELVDDIACYYGKDYRWQWVSNTIDTAFFSYQERLPHENRPYRFCCLADYQYRKGYDVLFAAYRQLQERGCEVELHIAGQDTDNGECLKEIERLQLRGVKTYGRIGKRRVRELLWQSDALVLASRDETQGLVLLEALSTGIPVISTEAIPESVRLDEACWFVSVDDVDALAEMMRRCSRQEMVYDGRKASQLVRELASPEVVGKKLETIFSEIVSSR